MDTTNPDTLLDEPTRQPQPKLRLEQAQPRLFLTIALHPSLRRIGERAELTPLRTGDHTQLSRRTPEFRTADGRLAGPLGDPHISRSPLLLRAGPGGGVVVDRSACGSTLEIDGVTEPGPLQLDAAALARGVTLTLAGRVVLLLQRAWLTDEVLPKYGLIGESGTIQAIRRDIAHASGLDVSVLIRGESGTGKELVARALHAASPRAAKPYISLNMAALSPQIAIAELFGHARGSFTGAVQAREGYFRQADGGTIFLDEIGEAPVEVQAALLRVLETGEVQPIGGTPTRRVDVRVLAATDADLSRSMQQGSFRAALYHRLATYELPVPPLRERRDDIPRLFVHFLEHELRRVGRADLFERLAAEATGRLTTQLMAQLVTYAWPGNVRELHNVTCRIAATLLAGSIPSVSLPRSTDAPVEQEPATTPAPGAPGGAQLSDDALIASLEEHDWQVAATARTLGLSRNTLYARIRRCEQLQTGHALDLEALRSLYERHRGDLAAMAEESRVSVRALQLRLRSLGLLR